MSGKGKVSVVVGGQFGSEAKGAVAGYLASQEDNTSRLGQVTPVVCVRVGGPNAGHTVYGKCPIDCEGGEGHLNLVDQEHPWRLRQVPVAAVTNRGAKLVIAAGSEVDFEVLNLEITQLNSAGYAVNDRLFVDQSATVLTPAHIDQERARNLSGRIGSTAKGIGAARADRLMREAITVGDAIADGGVRRFNLTDCATFLRYELGRRAHVVIEGTQGYGLGLHTRYYPMCTSGDARAIDFLAQAGLSPWANYIETLDVWVVVRTRPIRVAGNSGPLPGETTWEELGLKEERTTVTQKVRRVGEFDEGLVREAVFANGGGGDNGRGCVQIALTMVDYEIPNLFGVETLEGVTRKDYASLCDLAWWVGDNVGARVSLVGTSPTTILDLRQ